MDRNNNLISFWVLFIAQLKILVRNHKGFFWTALMPLGIYTALSALPIKDFAGTNIRYSVYLLPGIIAMTVMQGGIYSLAYWLVDMKSRGAIKRLKATPLTKPVLILSLLSSRLVLMIVQVFMLTAVGIWFFGAEFSGHVFLTGVLVLLGGSIFLLIGLLIGSFADTYEAAAPITAAIGLPFIFLGDVFYPLQKMPMILQNIGNVLPITYLSQSLRGVYLSEIGFRALGLDLLVLISWFALLFLIVVWRFKFED